MLQIWAHKKYCSLVCWVAEMFWCIHKRCGDVFYATTLGTSATNPATTFCSTLAMSTTTNLLTVTLQGLPQPVQRQ
jgi:hypothetical protein